MGITLRCRVKLMADSDSPYMVSYMCSIHFKVISGIFKKICTILPYMGITVGHRVKLMADLDSPYMVSYT